MEFEFRPRTFRVFLSLFISHCIRYNVKLCILIGDAWEVEISCSEDLACLSGGQRTGTFSRLSLIPPNICNEIQNL